MSLLNNREREVFENDYQWLSNFPGWKMENVFTLGSVENTELDKFSRLICTGKNRLSRLNIASHEAGHAVVMTATYCFVDKVLIDVKDDPDGLLGFVEPCRSNKDESSPQPVKKNAGMPCKTLIMMDILVISAGFIGESFTAKKTGSNHEKFPIYCKCRHLDDLDGVEPLTNWNHYVGWCRRIIFNNEHLFWEIVDDLLGNSELTERAKILLHDKIKQEPAELFFN